VLVTMSLLVSACGSTITGAPPTSTRTPDASPTVPGNAEEHDLRPAPDAGGRCHSRDGLPDPACTPGAVDPAVTAANLATALCRPGGGYSASVRPPMSVTGPIKRALMASYGIDAPMSAVELDHLVPISLGGDPGGPAHAGEANLWPQLWGGGLGARAKDRLELKLLQLVCRHQLDLVTAQEAIATDWVSAYKRYIG